jgi:hypothetical protein
LLVAWLVWVLGCYLVVVLSPRSQNSEQLPWRGEEPDEQAPWRGVPARRWWRTRSSRRPRARE